MTAFGVSVVSGALRSPLGSELSLVVSRAAGCERAARGQSTFSGRRLWLHGRCTRCPMNPSARPTIAYCVAWDDMRITRRMRRQVGRRSSPARGLVCIRAWAAARALGRHATGLGRPGCGLRGLLAARISSAASVLDVAPSVEQHACVAIEGSRWAAAVARLSVGPTRVRRP